MNTVCLKIKEKNRIIAGKRRNRVIKQEYYIKKNNKNKQEIESPMSVLQLNLPTDSDVE